MTYNRLQILESLGNLDPVQAEKVLTYIKGLSNNVRDEEYRRFKRRAMREIRTALMNQPAE